MGNSRPEFKELDVWIVEVLVRRLQEKGSVITYSDLAKEVKSEKDCPPINPHVSFNHPLGRIQKACFEVDVPCIPVMVVGKTGMKPGTGFVAAYKEIHPEQGDEDEKAIAKKEWERVRECRNWQPLLDYYGIELEFIAPKNYKIERIAEESYKESSKIVEKISKEIARNPEARKRCLELKGTSCVVCGFDSESLYGIPGVIHVHHLKPLSEELKTRGEVITDPVKDLVPVCPNCHALIHSKGSRNECYSIEEAKAIIN